ncbi:GTPase [Bacteroides sp. GD17]|jgi:GTPase SAR1 family protein|uniref:GTPase n=1 Tax=Bacteroides sp. GD17 TaxID=3139826 RepID=UPI0025EE1C11|nr:GTPase [uncultured Bacteroides sp.]
METTNLKIAELSKKLQELVKKTYDLLDRTGNENIKEALNKELSELRERVELKIAFVGQYSSGKSTIISALTGNRDIKIDANVATDVVSEYKWNNIVLMDTPGILAGKVEQHDQRTKDALKECDLIVYVLTSQLFDDVIFENFIDLAYTQKLNDKMLIAINKMSMEAGDFDTLRQNYLNSIHSIFKERGYEFNFEVVFIDAADYIEGCTEEDDDFIQLSNFNSFISTLNSFVADKGLIKKQFDTPVRILKGHVADIAVSQVDPNLKIQAEHFSSRIRKSMRDMERSLALKLNQFESDSISDSMNVSSKIGEISETELENEVNGLSRQIEDRTTELLTDIEEMVNQNYSDLMSEMENFGSRESLLLFEKNLDARINSPSISLEERKNLEKQKTFLNYLSEGGAKLAQMSGVNSLNGGISQAAGSQAHTMIYNVGKFFGHKFKPWEAVKTASTLGKVAKFGIPVVTTLASIGLDLYAKNKEEKRTKEIAAAKNQLNADLRSKIKSIRCEIEKNFNLSVITNYKDKLEEVDRMKMEISNSMSKNENIKKALLELDAEYVDFIEIVE